MTTKDWWKESVVYQVYPKSFQDSDGDGFGDLRGIINRLDYLKELGIDVLWLCPVYQSPMDDGGYDISDYYTIDERFGTNEEMDELLEKANRLGIKVLMDLVVNHTSDEHEWFQKALADSDSKYRDYYIFREGVDGNPPNNWRSYFGDAAWEKVPNEENLFYLHAFTKKQPDLNWENEEVREEIYKMINHWLDKGLGGFRIDAILNIKKEIEYGQLEVDGEDGRAFIGHWILNKPGIEEWLEEMQERTFRPHNSMTVAEADVPEERLAEYIGEDGYYSMVFDFSYTDIDVPATGEWFVDSNWTWQQMRERIFNSQLMTQRNGWGALYLENHDQPRSINKYIPAEHINDYSKKMLATLFMCLRGTPFIYQGQEIGMENITLADIDTFDDVATYAQYYRGIASGLKEEEALKIVNHRSRDNSRTPMQWDSTQQAGFSEAETTWFPVNSNYETINVENERNNPNSVLHYYRQLIALRKNSPYQENLIYGEFVPVAEKNKEVIVYERQLEGQIIRVLINPTSVEQRVKHDGLNYFVIGNYPVENDMLEESFVLRPFESIVLANYGG